MKPNLLKEAKYDEEYVSPICKRNNVMLKKQINMMQLAQKRNERMMH